MEVDSVPECGKLAAEFIADAAGRLEVWRSAGFASRIDCQNPGEHSLKLGTPGLKYGRPLAFKARMSVYYASLNRNYMRPTAFQLCLILPKVKSCIHVRIVPNW